MVPINTSRQQAIDLGYQVDIGHVKGNEFWRTRNAAESLGWTQAQYENGTGLGLAIAKEIVRLHNGNITAESAGEITSFIITLPIEKG